MSPINFFNTALGSDSFLERETALLRLSCEGMVARTLRRVRKKTDRRFREEKRETRPTPSKQRC